MKSDLAAANLSDNVGRLQFANGTYVLGYGTVIVSLTANTAYMYVYTKNINNTRPIG